MSSDPKKAEKKKWLDYIKALKAYTKSVQAWVDLTYGGGITTLDEGSNPPTPPPPPPKNNS